MHRSPIRALLVLTALTLLLPTDASGAGTIEGKVSFEGRPKRNPIIDMSADPNCLSINEGKKVIQEYVSLNRDLSIDNVFVHLSGSVAYSGGPPAEPVVIDQQGCTYHPRISGAVTGQTLRITNSDPTLHNIHTQSEVGNAFNIGQPIAGQKHDHTLKGQELMLRLKCDVHPWMQGYVGVLSHPYFAVSADGGMFRIDGVPAGTYTLHAWQEKLGSLEQTIEVRDGETVAVDFAYGGAGATEGAALPIEELVIPALK